MRRLIIPLALAALLCLVLVPAEGSDAEPAGEIHHLSGNIIFTDDVTYGDGDTVIIDDGTVIDMFTFNWNIGEDSKVILEGRFTLMTYSGTITIGKDTSLVMHGTVLLGFGADVSYTYVGLVEFSDTYSQDVPAIKFRPISEDHCIHISWGQVTVSVGDFLMYQIHESDKRYERVFGFSSFVLDATYCDEEGVVTSVRSAQADIPDPSRVVTAGFDLEAETASITIQALNGITATDYYPASDTTSLFEVRNIEPMTISVGADSFGHVIGGAAKVSLVKTVGNQAVSGLVLSDVDLTTDIDILKTIELIIGGITGDTPDIIRNLLFTQSNAEISDAAYKTEKVLTDIVAKVDPSADPDSYTTVSAVDGDITIVAASAKPVVKSYALSQDFVLDIDCTISTASLTVRQGDTVTVSTLADTSLQTTRLDLKSLYLLYSRTGTLALQHILDNSGGFNFSSSTLTVDDGGDGEPEVTINSLISIMTKDARGIYTLTVSLTAMTANTMLEGRPTFVDLKGTSVYMESSGQLAECLDALLYNSHFTTDVHAEIQIANQGFEVDHELPGGSLMIKGGKVSEISPTSATLSISLDHSMFTGQTVLSGRLSSAGYEIFAMLHKTYTDPDGMLDITAESQNASMSFDTTFDGNRIGYSVNMNMPFAFTFGYYGIDLSGTMKASSYGITHGSLSLDGFDVSEDAILSLPLALLTSNFSTEFRVGSDLSEVVIYNQDEEFVSYTDITFDARKITADVDWSDKATLNLYEIRLDMCRTDGSELRKDLDHLTLVLDIKEEPSGKPLVDTVLEMALIPCLAIIAALAVVMLRLRKIRPDLFSFNEFEQHELVHMLPEDFHIPEEDEKKKE